MFAAVIMAFFYSNSVGRQADITILVVYPPPEGRSRTWCRRTPRSCHHQLACSHDRAEVPDCSVVAFRAATRAPAVPLELLDERHELLSPAPASVANAAHPGARAA